MLVICNCKRTRMTSVTGFPKAFISANFDIFAMVQG